MLSSSSSSFIFRNISSSVSANKCMRFRSWSKEGWAITRALTATAPDAPVLYHAGMIDARRGDVVSAKKYLYQAMSRNPYFSLLDVPTAAETLQKLGSANPKLPDGGVAVVTGSMTGKAQ